MKKIFKIFLSVLLIMISVILVYGLFIVSHTLNTENKVAHAMTLKTSKAEYEYGEPVEFAITRSDFPEEDESYYVIDGCNFQIGKIPDGKMGVDLEDSFSLQLNCKYRPQYSQKGDDYCRNLAFQTNKSETKTVLWDQKIYDEATYGMIQAIPGSYSVKISCNLMNMRGNKFEGITHGSIGTKSVTIKIKEPAHCADEKLQIIKSQYEPQDRALVISTVIKNTGNADIGYIRLVASKCDNEPKEDTSKVEEVFEGVKKGETKTYLITHDLSCPDSLFGKIQAQIYDCQNMNTDDYSYEADISKQDVENYPWFK